MGGLRLVRIRANFFNTAGCTGPSFGVSSTGLSATRSGLLPNTQHSFQVNASNSTAGSPQSVCFAISTQALPAPLPDAPTNLTLGESFNPSFTFGPATAATLSEIYTSWTLGALNGPSGTVLATIQRNVYANGTCAAPASGGSGFFTGTTESGALLNLSQFPAGSTVSFNVFMENDAGVSPFSNCVSTVVPNADVTAPTLLSVVRKTPSVATTDADSLTWTVTFDEEAIGVDASDFTLTNTSASLSVTPVNPRFIPFDTTPLTTVYDVTATGGDLASFEGVVGLQLAAGQNITDYTEVNFLSETVPSGANETYTLFTAPTVVSITRLNPATESTNADSLTWQIIFDKAVTNIDPSDFSVTGTSATITGLDQLSPTAFNVTASGGDLAGLSGTVTFGFASGQNITDTNNNELTNTAPTGTNDATYTLDNTAPTIASIERLNPAVSPTDADTVSWKITFSGVGLQNIDSSDFSVTGTTASLALTNITTKADFGDVYEASLSGGDLADINGTVTLLLAAGQNITDQAGNPLASTAPTGTNNNTYVMENSVEQTITFAQPADIPYGNASILVATSTSGLPVAFSTVSAGICEIKGTNILARGLGACVVNADQTGNEDTLAAPQVVHTINIVKKQITVVPSNRSKDFGTVLTLGTTLFTVKQNGIETPLPFGEAIDSVTMESAPGVSVNGVFNAAADPASEPFAEARTYNGNISITAVSGSNGFDENNYDITKGSSDLTIVDATPPTLVSVELNDPATSPTNADELMWTFTFSEAVTIINMSDFQVTGTTASVTYVGAGGGAGPCNFFRRQGYRR